LLYPPFGRTFRRGCVYHLVAGGLNLRILFQCRAGCAIIFPAQTLEKVPPTTNAEIMKMACKKPLLAVMAAGMGSRYGGLKQLEPVGPRGEAIIDYSLYDAARAGFGRVIFIVRPETAAQFRESVLRRAGNSIKTSLAFQRLDDLPGGIVLPAGRVKPWGTAHALLAARRELDAPFAVINADDYYGPDAFKKIYDFLTALGVGSRGRYAMVGYPLKNTLSESGGVSRGVCSVRADGTLSAITERTGIVMTGERVEANRLRGGCGIIYPDSTVSMNMWGFTPDFIEETEKRFRDFLASSLARDPMGSEYFLPDAVESLVDEGLAKVTVLGTSGRWYGLTYRQDRPRVAAAIAAMTSAGIYPAELWEEQR
jgi:hypothetical protein